MLIMLHVLLENDGLSKVVKVVMQVCLLKHQMNGAQIISTKVQINCKM